MSAESIATLPQAAEGHEQDGEQIAWMWASPPSESDEHQNPPKEQRFEDAGAMRADVGMATGTFLKFLRKKPTSRMNGIHLAISVRTATGEHRDRIVVTRSKGSHPLRITTVCTTGLSLMRIVS